MFASSGGAVANISPVWRTLARLSAQPSGLRKNSVPNLRGKLISGREHLNRLCHVEQLNLRKDQDFGQLRRVAGFVGSLATSPNNASLH